MGGDAPRLRARLDHVELNSPDPGALAQFYSRALDLSLEQLSADRWLCRAPQRRILIARGERNRLAFGAYVVEDDGMLAAVRDRAARAGAAIEPSPTPLFAEGAFAVVDPDGNRIALGTSIGGREEPAGRV